MRHVKHLKVGDLFILDGETCCKSTPWGFRRVNDGLNAEEQFTMDNDARIEFLGGSSAAKSSQDSKPLPPKREEVVVVSPEDIFKGMTVTEVPSRPVKKAGAKKKSAPKKSVAKAKAKKASR